MKCSELLNLDIVGLSESEEPQTRSFLEGIQGNIVKSHGRDYACYLFLHFMEGHVRDARRALATLLPSIVTTAEEQRQQTLRWKAREANAKNAANCIDQCESTVFGMFALSASGYQRLRITEYGPAPDVDSPNADSLFQAGLREANANYLRWDASTDAWEENYKTPGYDIHGLILMADDDEEILRRSATQAKRQLTGSAIIVAEEFGRRQVRDDPDGKPNEHFGFRDGIAAPKDPRYLLARELAIQGDASGYGTYLVYLKLEQNVLKFKTKAREASRIAKEKFGFDISPEEFEELIVGRRKNGLSLMDAPIGSCSAIVKSGNLLPQDELDDFDYSRDADQICPAHSHVRKMNRRPKGQMQEFQIARRGVSYGPERRDLEFGSQQLPPSDGVGLLFVSLQPRIAETVALLVRASRGDKDALIGRSRTSSGIATEALPNEGQPWPLRRPYDRNPEPRQTAEPSVFRYEMSDFVTLKGGEYFFVPSMNFINKLGTLIVGDF